MSRRPPSWLRTALFAVGCLLVIVSPLVGLVPGPGGLIVFALGAALMLKTSQWAKRQFVFLKRRWPRFGDMLDRGLRRPSARRRRALSEPAD
jgi:hypothetical protein